MVEIFFFHSIYTTDLTSWTAKPTMMSLNSFKYIYVKNAEKIFIFDLNCSFYISERKEDCEEPNEWRYITKHFN